MNLRDARLCLDCEELHTEERCPACASETFSFVTRWIPANDDRAQRSRERSRARREAVSKSLTIDRPIGE